MIAQIFFTSAGMLAALVAFELWKGRRTPRYRWEIPDKIPPRTRVEISDLTLSDVAHTAGRNDAEIIANLLEDQ